MIFQTIILFDHVFSYNTLESLNYNLKKGRGEKKKRWIDGLINKLGEKLGKKGIAILNEKQ